MVALLVLGTEDGATGPDGTVRATCPTGGPPDTAREIACPVGPAGTGRVTVSTSGTASVEGNAGVARNGGARGVVTADTHADDAPYDVFAASQTAVAMRGRIDGVGTGAGARGVWAGAWDAAGDGTIVASAPL